jgi:hypothetical protein
MMASARSGGWGSSRTVATLLISAKWLKTVKSCDSRNWASPRLTSLSSRSLSNTEPTSTGSTKWHSSWSIRAWLRASISRLRMSCAAAPRAGGGGQTGGRVSKWWLAGHTTHLQIVEQIHQRFHQLVKLDARGDRRRLCYLVDVEHLEKPSQCDRAAHTRSAAAQQHAPPRASTTPGWRSMARRSGLE